jgi:hypothetical protein
MESEIELEDAKNEVLRKIGRNMLLFQQMEKLLKFLIINGKIEGYTDELKSKQEQRSETIYRKTMGKLVGDYIEDTFSDFKEIPQTPKDSERVFISFRLNLETDSVYFENKKKILAEIVSDRNELIHNFLPNYDLTSIEGCREIEEHLDQQREKLLPELNEIKIIIENLVETKNLFYDFLNSDDGKKRFFSPIRGGRILYYLGEIASQIVRPDGWTPLSVAGQIIWKQKPEEITDVFKKYCHKTLKKLIMATEIFEIKEEPTKNGGIQVLYRLKPGWTFEIEKAENRKLPV